MDEPETIISFALDKAIAENPSLVRQTMIDLMIQVAELQREIMKLKGQDKCKITSESSTTFVGFKKEGRP